MVSERGEMSEIYRVFAWWSTLVMLKILAMLPITAYQRFSKKVFITPEDPEYLGFGVVSYTHPDVERVRSAHRSDLKNIIPWFICTAMWLTTSPNLWLAKTFIKTFVISRIIYTLIYAVIPFPIITRTLLFLVTSGIMIYQTFCTMLYYAHHVAY